MVAATIRRVGIVDDNADARETLLDEFRQVEPFSLEGPYASAETLLAELTQLGDAAICDHHLINYVPCYGSDLVARLYQNKYPAVLRTKYGKADIERIRLNRRNIPVIMPSDEFNPDSFFRAWEICAKEFIGEFTVERRPWRTVIQIEECETDADVVFVVLPGWNSREVIKLSKECFPNSLHQYLRAGERFVGQVNKGAECQEDLYFSEITYSRT